MLWQLFLITILVWCLIVRWRNRDKRKMAEYFKTGLTSWPIVGLLYLFIGNAEDHMNSLKRLSYDAIKRGGVIAFWSCYRLYAVIVDPVEAEIVLKNCLEKDDLYRFMRILTANGSVFAPVSVWRRRRKFNAPTFSLRNLNQFVNVFSEQSKIMVKRLEEVADKGTFSIWSYITSYAMLSICQSTMGIKLDNKNPDDQPFIQNFEKFAKLTAARIVIPLYHSDFIYRLTPYHKENVEAVKNLTSYVTKIIKDKREAINKTVVGDFNKVATKSLLEELINYSGDDKAFTDTELLEEMLVMLLAGTDTSAVGAAFTTIMLSKHLDVQEKLHRELTEVLGEEDRRVTAEDLPHLNYLEAVIRETLRLYPSVPIIGRKTDKDITLNSGRKIAKDVAVLISIWGTNRNPKYWGPDAEVFRPERFLDLKLDHPAAFLPFSFGIRNCIGYKYAMMSLKTVLATLVRCYKILPSDQMSEDDDKPLRVSYNIMMRHMDNFQIKLVRRK